MHNDWVLMLAGHPSYANLQKDDQKILHLVIDIRDKIFDAVSSSMSLAYN